MGWHLAKTFAEAGDASSVPLAAQASISGGSRPFGYRFGQVEGRGKACILIETAATQAAIAQMRTMRQDRATLFEIRDAMRAQGLQISYQTVRRVLSQGDTPSFPRRAASATAATLRRPSG